ncbi:MAG: hypothetical protein VXY77_04870 [Pseudomonadota bacterium]|nr:hypothetical protein [Pseudomonadota bacterium]
MSHDEISQEVLDDIAYRARLGISKEHMQNYKSSFIKIIQMLDSVASVDVCEFKDYATPPTPCHHVAADNIENMDHQSKILNSCQHYNPETGLFEVPKVID